MGARPGLTAAQRLNRVGAAARRYELWRRRSLTWLTGQHFPLASELALLEDLASPGRVAVDLACATGVYARHLARRQGTSTVVAVDLARPMLEQVRWRARRAGVLRQIAPVLALARALPLRDGSVDSVYCGGSANELGDLEGALAEVRRVLRPGGASCWMLLTEAVSRRGRLVQMAGRFGGLSFFPLESFVRRLEGAGLEVRRREAFGVVAFVVAERRPDA